MEQSHLTRLSLSSLDRLSEGEAGKVIDEAIRRAVADLNAHRNRKTRKVEITLSMTLTDDGRISATVTARTILPPGSTKIRLASSASLAQP